MPTMPPRGRSLPARAALAVSAVTALAALAACGSGGSGGSDGATNSPSTSVAGTSMTPSASGSAATPNASTTSMSSTGGVAKPSGAMGSAIPKDPWNHPAYKVGFFVPPASVGGQENPVVVRLGKYSKAPGQENWGIIDTGKTERYERVSTGRYYVSCLYAGRKGPADGSDRCPVTMDQLDQYIIDHRSAPPEFWYHLDSKGRIDLAFQVFHP